MFDKSNLTKLFVNKVCI